MIRGYIFCIHASLSVTLLFFLARLLKWCYLVIGTLNVGLALHVSVSLFLFTTTNLLIPLVGFAIAGCVYTVSHDANSLCSTEDVHFLRFQTASHSVLATRIVLHTGRVLRQSTVDLELPDCRRASHSVELQRLINEGT